MHRLGPLPVRSGHSAAIAVAFGVLASIIAPACSSGNAPTPLVSASTGPTVTDEDAMSVPAPPTSSVTTLLLPPVDEQRLGGRWVMAFESVSQHPEDGFWPWFVGDRESVFLWEIVPQCVEGPCDASLRIVNLDVSASLDDPEVTEWPLTFSDGVYRASARWGSTLGGGCLLEDGSWVFDAYGDAAVEIEVTPTAIGLVGDSWEVTELMATRVVTGVPTTEATKAGCAEPSWDASEARGVALDDGEIPTLLPEGSEAVSPIAFMRGAEPKWDIWAVGPSATEPVLLIEDGLLPAWSPDGRRIAFVRRSGTSAMVWRNTEEIWLANADGSQPTFLARGTWPQWAPSGESIAFHRKVNMGGVVTLPDGSYNQMASQTDVFLVSTRTGVVDRATYDGWPSFPVWLDDMHLAVGGVHSKPYFSVQVGDAFEYRLLHDEMWHPRTQAGLIVFHDLTGFWWTMDPDGSKVSKLPVPGAFCRIPQDGPRWFAFVCPEGSYPTLSPDRETIVYSHGGELSRINVDGTNRTALTSVGDALFPSWAPLGR